MINKKTIEDLLYKTTPILVVLAVLVHTNNILGYMGFGPDNIVQSVTALSLMEGQGLSIPFANPDDLSESTYEPFGRFPPGFALLLAPILYLTGNNLIASIHFYHILAVLLFFFTCYLLLRLFSEHINKLAFPLLFGFWIFAYNPFKVMGSTDLLSLTSFYLALYFALKLIIKRPSNQYRYIILIALFSFLCSFFRYAYYPQTFVIPGLVFLIALIHNNRKEIVNSIYIILGTGVLMLIQMVYQKMKFESVNFLAIDNRLLHLENLQTINPVISNGFIAEDIISRNFPSVDTGVFNIVLSLFISVLLSIGMYQVLSKDTSIKKLKSYFNHPIKTLLIFCVSSALVMSLFLTVLSLIYPSFSLDPSVIQSFVTLPRYFAIVSVMMHIIVVILICVKNFSVSRIVQYSLVFLIVISSLFNGYNWLIHAKKLSMYDPNEMNYQKDYFMVADLVEEQETSLVIIDGITNQFIYRLATFYGARTIKYAAIKESGIQFSKPIDIWLALPHSTGKSEDPTILKYNGEKILSLTHLNIDIYQLSL